MNYSPFEIFRRNLKPMMVFLTLLALMAFVVLPTLQSYMQTQAGGGGGDAVVAKFAGTTLQRSRVDYFTRNHQSTVRFLAELAEETIARGGTPQTPGFQYDAQKKQVQRLGINENPSINGTIRTFMFAAEAKEAGFELDDSSLSRWLESFSGGVISDSEITARLMKATSNKMGRPHLYEQLRNHLLADVYLRRGNAALTSNDGVLLTPSERWKNFLKLNQSATITAYGVLVNDYLDQTNKSPSDSKIREVFEEGKDRNPSEQSAEPAFHRQYTARFEYLVGDYQQFLDAEIAKLTGDQIKSEYERRIKGGDFQLPAEPAEEQAEPAEEVEEPSAEEASDDESAEDMPAEDVSEENGTSGEEAEPESEPADRPEVETEEMEPEATEDADEPKPEATDEGEDSGEVNDAETTVDEANEVDEAEEVESDQSKLMGTSAVRLVAFQNEDNDDSDTDDSDNAADSDTAADSEPQKDQTDDEKKPANGNRPLSEVRDQISEDLAGPAARKAMDSAVTKVNQAMKDYFSQLAIHQSNLSIGKESKEPVRPNMKSLADELGLKYESIGPHTRTSIAEEPIAESFEVGSQFGRRGPGFPIMMFGFNNGQTELAPQPLFAAVRTADDQRGKIYVSWKVEETAEFTPTLDQAREEVIMAIRMDEARELAKAAAEKIANSTEAEQDLASAIPDDKKSNLKESLGPFTWMNSFGFQGATIGNVPELDSVGNDFMKAVFAGDQGALTVAANDPQRVFYVVKPTKFEPTVEELQTQFKQPMNRLMARMVATDANEVLSGYYESIDKKTGFESFVEAE